MNVYRITDPVTRAVELLGSCTARQEYKDSSIIVAVDADDQAAMNAHMDLGPSAPVPETFTLRRHEYSIRMVADGGGFREWAVMVYPEQDPRHLPGWRPA